MTGKVANTHEETTMILKSFVPKEIKLNDIVFACVGTDRSTGDCLAPLVGSKLVEAGYKNVIGTIDQPLHALNIEETIKTINPNKYVIAIDCSLGKKEDIGSVIIKDEALRPGKALNKKLTPIGDLTIQGVLNQHTGSSDLNFQVLQNTRLAETIQMADTIFKSILKVCPIENKLLRIIKKLLK